MSHQHLPPLDWGTFLSTWQSRPGWLVVSVLLLVAYVVGVQRGHRHGGTVGPIRVACFVLGLVLLMVCLCSAVDAYAMSLFWMHMVEHLTLITVVPALLVLGHPLTVLRNAGGDVWRARVDRLLQTGPISWLLHPLLGLTAYGVVVFFTHLTPFMDKMAMHPSLMTLEQVLYVGSGAWLLLGAIGDEPIRWRTPYLLRIALLVMAMVPDTLVGVVLLQTQTDPFPRYMAMRPDWAPGALHDLDVGGSLMWAGGDGLMMLLALGVVIALLSRQRDSFLGTWLESARTGTMVGHVERSGGRLSLDDGASVDDDDAALAAYNDMLRRLGTGGESRSRES
ncbi:MAG: cytochrome c oxidase assembly protein [Nocardioides sp.]